MSACTLFWQFGRLVQSVLTISWLISVQYPVMAGADCDPLYTLWSGKGTPELIRLRNQSSAPLLPSTWSAFQRVCFQWTLLTHMSALYDSSGPWAPTYKVRKEISCLSPWQWCKRPQVTLSTLPFHITLPALGPIPKSGKKNSPTGGGFELGRPTMLLCIKGQITLSDVIFLWVIAVRDDSTCPHGWCVKRFERQGLTEVLGSYQTGFDLPSLWIPWGKRKPGTQV